MGDELAATEASYWNDNRNPPNIFTYFFLV